MGRALAFMILNTGWGPHTVPGATVREDGGITLPVFKLGLPDHSQSKLAQLPTALYYPSFRFNNKLRYVTF
jgi:hypothetical protein